MTEDATVNELVRNSSHFITRERVTWREAVDWTFTTGVVTGTIIGLLLLRRALKP